MKRNEIKVEHLEIRLKNGDLRAAQELRTAIGGELLKHIAEWTNAPLRPAAIKVGHLDAGTARLESVSPAKSSSAIAQQIAVTMGSKLTRSTRGNR